MEVQNLFANSRVNITNEGKRNLSAGIGSTEYRDEYVKDLIKDWDDQPTILSAIAETHSQEAYSAFTSGFKNKLDCFLRNIPNILHLPLPLERTIRNKFIPAVTEGQISNDKKSVLTPLPTKYDGLTIRQQKSSLLTSRKIASEPTTLIRLQSLQ